MKIPKIHIGDLIEARIKEIGITKAEFCRRMHTSRQNVSTMLGKSDLATDTLRKASEVLDCNFFLAYCQEDEPYSQPLIYKVEFNSTDLAEIESLKRWVEGKKQRQGI